MILFVKTVLSLMVLFTLSSCRRHVGTFNVGGDSRPRFTFSGSSLNHLLVYRVPRKYIDKQIPLDELKKDNPDTQWLLEGTHDANVHIDYGIVPKGMKEIVRAKPLAEGEIYLASIYISTEETGAFVGQYFRMESGRTIQINEPIGNKP
jgi:hypothetical protein